MLFVRQRVHDAQRRRRLGEDRQPALRERADDDARRPSVRGCATTSCSGSRSACITSDGMSTTSPPSSPHADREGDARAQRRLLEEQSDLAAGQRCARAGRAGARGRSAPSAEASVEAARQVVGGEIETARGSVWRTCAKVLGPVLGVDAGRTSSTGRTSTRWRVCAPPAPSVDLDLEVGALQVGGGLGRPLVERPAVLEEHQRADAHARASSTKRAPERPAAATSRPQFGIAAVNRGLHEQRVGDGARGHPRVGVATRRRWP